MKNIFDITNVKNINFKNRFIRSAVWENLADKSGHMTNELFDVYEHLSKGGVGTIITGYAYVLKEEKPNPGMMGIYDDSFIDEYKELTNMVHKNNTNIIMQIVYGGFMTRYDVGNRLIWGPSDAIDENFGTKASEMSKDDIKTIINAFKDAAKRVKESGFDGVQIHCAHGYLLSQFISPYFNKREDEYGGSIENRARIVFEIYDAIRKEVGKDYLISIKLNSSDYVSKGGLVYEDSLYIANKLSYMGIDLIEVSGGNGSIKEVIENGLGAGRKYISKQKNNTSYFREYAKELSSKSKSKVALVGGNRDIDELNEILNDSNIEYFSLARPLICEPNLIDKIKYTDDKSMKCISCNNCYKNNKACIINN